MPCLGLYRGMLRVLQVDPSFALATCAQESRGLGRSWSGVTRLFVLSSRSTLVGGLSSRSGSVGVSQSTESRAMVQSWGMAESDRNHLADVASLFPAPPGQKISYGTAGFRADATLLMSTVFRCGVLAALRSLCTRQVTGLMITASHNPLPENGVKLADPQGGMLVMEWEAYADALANAMDRDTLLQVIDQIVKNENIPIGDSVTGKVLLARDTRPSGASLVAAAIQGVQVVAGCVAEDRGVLSTPQLHWMVRSVNQGLHSSETEYFSQLSEAFRNLVKLGPKLSNVALETLIVDGANGVGGMKLECLQQLLGVLNLEIRNFGREGDGFLNDGVGADYVQKEKVPPKGFGTAQDVGRKCVSLDGDADRLVYFYQGHLDVGIHEASIRLLDGDKILILFASFIKDQLQVLASGSSSNNGSFALPGYGYAQLGVVQTAYANGASTEYLRHQIGLEVALAKTGVKHLHGKAADYDIGIYFEANGHGTILFKAKFLEWLKEQQVSTHEEVEGHHAILRLLAVSQMVNQAVGDALSGVLMVETVLLYRHWSIKDWDQIYSDLPSRMLKVKVADRNLIATESAETRVAHPPVLQAAIDAEVAMYKGGRAFVRPSGTEDVVRVYAEASEPKDAELLAHGVAKLVHKLAGGIGSEP